MEEYLQYLIDGYGHKDYDNFIGYVYTTLQREIDSKKKNKDKDKYIILRDSILKYIISNKKSLTLKLSTNS